MISAEVPVMLSKALELFITELSLRAWLQTEESKRRTVQVNRKPHYLPFPMLKI
jgi:nuclear transcription factor Y gamma